MKLNKKALLLFILSASILIQCGPDAATQKTMTDAKNLFGTIPEKMPGSDNDTQELISLGKKLYHEKKLSINDTQSCSSCHNVNDGGHGVDNQQFSKGALPGTLGGRNAPTSLNAGFHIAQFWDGRAPTLADQAKGPILNPVEMGMPNSDAVMDKLSKIKEYKELFAKSFPKSKQAMTYDNLALAIAAFERTLITQDRFDDFMNGSASALNAEELQGLALFTSTGCASCHNGPLLGGNSYRKMGEKKPYKNTKDKGRYDLTKKQSDMYVFKVPSLRNIAVTAPYFHDGGVPTLNEAVNTMARIQLGKELTKKEVDLIGIFLKSLTGKNINN